MTANIETGELDKSVKIPNFWESFRREDAMNVKLQVKPRRSVTVMRDRFALHLQGSVRICFLETKFLNAVHSFPAQMLSTKLVHSLNIVRYSKGESVIRFRRLPKAYNWPSLFQTRYSYSWKNCQPTARVCSDNLSNVAEFGWSLLDASFSTVLHCFTVHQEQLRTHKVTPKLAESVHMSVHIPDMCANL